VTLGLWVRRQHRQKGVNGGHCHKTVRRGHWAWVRGGSRRGVHPHGMPGRPGPQSPAHVPLPVITNMQTPPLCRLGRCRCRHGQGALSGEAEDAGGRLGDASVT
jgi:hypothetical protein